MIAELSEGTKRVADIGAAGLAVLSLSQVSLVLTVIATTMTILWYGVRFYDRFIVGRKADD